MNLVITVVTKCNCSTVSVYNIPVEIGWVISCHRCLEVLFKITGEIRDSEGKLIQLILDKPDKELVGEVYYKSEIIKMGYEVEEYQEAMYPIHIHKSIEHERFWNYEQAYNSIKGKEDK